VFIHGGYGGVPYSILERLKERRELFDAVSGWSDLPAPIEVSGQTTVGLVVRVDRDLQRVLLVAPRIGRALTGEDPGTAAVVSHRFWRDRLGADPRALGRVIRAGRMLVGVIGVMPEEFSGMDTYVPWDVTIPLETRPFVVAIGRLRPGVSAERARAQLQAMWPQLLADTLPPGRTLDEWTKEAGGTARVGSASRGRFFWREQYGRTLSLLLGMAGLVLLIVCSNLATVLLAQALGRRKEMAIKLALGASRGRLVRQALWESLLLGTAGCAASLLVARWSAAAGLRFLPVGNVPFNYRIGIGGRALTFAAVLAMVTALACGLLPAIRATRTGVMEAIRGGGSLNPAGGRTRRVLVTLQVALSTVLVTAALLFAISLEGLAPSLGFRPDGVAALMVEGRPSETAQAGPAYFVELIRRLRSIPGVERVGIANQLPMQYAGYEPKDSDVSTSGGPAVAAERHCAFPDYFAAMGSPVLQGRDFRTDDRRVALANRGLARLLFGSENAVGNTVHVKRDGAESDWVLAGVVEDMKYGSPREAVQPAYYLPCLEEWSPHQAAISGFGIAMRGSGAGLERAARREVEAMGRHYVLKSAPLTHWLGQRTLQERMLAVVSSIFGALTLSVAAVGLYGLMAFLVAARTREIAIRVALGAQRSDVRRLVARETLLVTSIGLAFGLGGAAAAAKLAESYLFAIHAHDPRVLAASALALAATAAAAAFVPIRRAVALDPLEALRHE
ncbi:MAG TPA: FtsX-like permease family protein, partial [Bryobacteraceae bacterium]